MKNKIIKCWGRPFGRGEEVTIEKSCKNISEFEQYMEQAGHLLTGKPYIAARKRARRKNEKN